MIKGVLTALAILVLTNLGLGWYLGYRSLTPYLAFWLLSAFVAFASVRLAQRAFGSFGFTDTIIRSGVLAFALTVLGGLVLGSLGLIGTIPYLLFFAGCAAASLISRKAPRPLAVATIPLGIAAVLVPALIFVIAVAAIKSPFTLYDSLSYHLFLPARWLQEHRLSIIATPFSDEAQAYAPANGELWFLWLMLPFHGDVLARIGQLPFFLLGGVALYGLARRMGAKPVHAMYVPVFYALTKRVVEQAVGADVDLICWGMFLAALYIGLAAIKSNDRRDWVLWGISLGLYFGSKYVSLVYGPIVLLLPLIGGFRRRALWALPGILVFALPWYLRNWVIAGSPIYPSSVVVAGITIAQGAYTHAAMMNSILHATSLRLLPVMLCLAFGTTLFFFWIPFALAGAWNLASARPRGPNLFLLLAPVVMAYLYWFGVPDNLDCRFLLPVTMLGLLPISFAFGANRTWNACVHGLFAAGVLWVVIGWRGELPIAPLPWPIGNWLTFGGMVARDYVWLFIGLGGVAMGIAAWLARQPNRAVPALTAIVCATAVVLAVPSRRWCPPDGCQFLEISPTYIRPPMLIAWAWLTEHVTDATIAYSGNNLPYPLVGGRLSNRVYYVNIDHHRDWRFHDYDRAHRRRPGPVPPSVLAASSGILKALPGPAQWHVDAVRPRYERMEGNRDAWIHNLKSLGVEYLFVSVLSAYEIGYTWHNDAGLPIEDEWARADPTAFKIVYESPEVRIFAVHLE